MGMLGELWREFWHEIIATFDSRADDRRERRNSQDLRVGLDEATGDPDRERELRKRWKALRKAKSPEDEERAVEAMLAWSGEKGQDGPPTE